MLTWGEFSTQQPDLASACRSLMYQWGVGLAFLGTVRADGGPRLHPMCPLIMDEGLFAFLIPSPKRDDLHRDPRYAMHSFPADENEDAFYLTGEARPVNDRTVWSASEAQFLRERSMDAAPPYFDEHQLLEFEIEGCLYTKTTGHGDPRPEHQRWRAP
jgi:hypothetical protein